MVNLARLLLARQELDGARRLLEEALPYHRAALKANPDDSPTLASFVMFALRYGRIEEAKPHLLHMIDLEAKMPEAARW